MTPKLLLLNHLVVRVQFATFELDTEAGRLFKHGIPILVRDQPLQVLIALVEHAGDVVTREQLRRRLWSDRAFGDFEAGLNTAMSRLRLALHDSAAARAFIETVPKRGYRFVASVTRQPSAAAPACKPEAYAAYLKGHYLTKRHTPANSARALEYYAEAIRLDPGCALAYHGASVMHILNALVGAAPPRQSLDEAERLVARALALDRDSTMVQNTLAMLRMFQWRWREAETAYRRAIAIEPANPHPHMMYALHCSFLRRHAEAVAEARKALDLDPVDPMMNFRVVQCDYYARRFEDAVRGGRVAIELAPDFPHTYAVLAQALAGLSRFDEAWRIVRKGRSLAIGEPIIEGVYGSLAALTGRRAEAREVLKRFDARRASSYCPALPAVSIHLALGDAAAALDSIELAYAEREPFLASAWVSPALDPLHRQSRFKRLLRRMEFPV